MKLRAKNKLLNRKNIIVSSVVAAALVTGGVSAYYLNTTKPQNANVAEVQQSDQTPEPSLSPTSTTETVADTTPESVTPSPSVDPSPSQTPQSTNPYGSDTMQGYVYDRRVSSNKKVDSWGMTTTWVYFARKAGLSVDKSPQKYDIAIIPMGSWVSVAFVEKVNTDGSIVISSKNDSVRHEGNSEVVTETIQPNDIRAQNYQFIH